MAEKIRFEARNRVQDFFYFKGKEGILVGAAGTGKTRGALESIHLKLSKYPGSRCLMTRRTRASMTETCLFTYTKEVLTPYDKVRWSPSEQKFFYPSRNGETSEMVVAGLDDPRKIMSAQYDIIYVQEATDISLEAWADLKTRLRNFKIPYQQILGDCNPGAPSHWIKRMANAGEIELFNTTHEDNPRWYRDGQWTEQGQHYLSTLDSLPGVRRLRLRHGIWAPTEGMVYEHFDPQFHVVDRFKVPDHWPFYWVVDFGYRDPFVWQMWTYNPEENQLYLVLEIYMTGRIVEDHADQIKEVVRGYPRPHAVICDHDAEGRATLEKHLDIITLPAYKKIHDGIQATQRRMGRPMEDQRPSIFFMADSLVEEDTTLKVNYQPTCTTDEFGCYMWDPKRPDVPVDANNHGCDATRYMVSFIDNRSVDPHDLELFDELADDDNRVRISRF